MIRAASKSASEQAREWAGRLRADRDHDLRLGDHQTSALATLLETLAADNERKTKALEVIVDYGSGGKADGCGNFMSGDCASAGRVYGAKYGADRWCDVCVARAALRPKEDTPTVPDFDDYTVELKPSRTIKARIQPGKIPVPDWED